MGTVKRSRNPTVVLTGDGEAHTHEDAQEFVHDLNQFVTVQLLEETPAILSLGKLCKDHGYSFEWVSGQEPRLTREGKSIICKTDNFVPLVVPRLSVNYGSSSCPYIATTGIVEDQKWTKHLETELHRAHLKVQYFERSDEQATRRLEQESLKIQPLPLPEKRGMTRRMRTIRWKIFLFWLEDFQDNLVDSELPAPAHSSRWIRLRTTNESGNKNGGSTALKLTSRNVLRKWYQNPGSIVFFLTSQKTEIAKSACEPK